MPEKFFAFETNEAAIAFPIASGLGDAVIAKKFLSAVVELAPNCFIDVFCLGESQKNFIQSFYSDIRNLNLIMPLDEHYQIVIQNYDLIFEPAGTWGLFLKCIHPQKLKAVAPELFQVVKKLRNTTKQTFKDGALLLQWLYEILPYQGF